MNMLEKENVAEKEKPEQKMLMNLKSVQQSIALGTVEKVRTEEEIALEQGYYACCFRSH